MKIGVVSDTHNNLTNVAQIVALFNASAVDRVVHTGDITQAKTLDAFAQLQMPMVGVFGNNDLERSLLESAIAKHGFEFCEPPLQLTWHRRSIIVVHDPLELDEHLNLTHDLALHGHTHLLRNDYVAQTLVFNPGECAGHIRGCNAVGIVDLEQLSAQVMKF